MAVKGKAEQITPLFMQDPLLDNNSALTCLLCFDPHIAGLLLSGLSLPYSSSACSDVTPTSEAIQEKTMPKEYTV